MSSNYYKHNTGRVIKAEAASFEPSVYYNFNQQSDQGFQPLNAPEYRAEQGGRIVLSNRNLGSLAMRNARFEVIDSLPQSAAKSAPAEAPAPQIIEAQQVAAPTAEEMEEAEIVDEDMPYEQLNSLISRHDVILQGECERVYELAVRETEAVEEIIALEQVVKDIRAENFPDEELDSLRDQAIDRLQNCADMNQELRGRYESIKEICEQAKTDIRELRHEVGWDVKKGTIADYAQRQESKQALVNADLSVIAINKNIKRLDDKISFSSTRVADLMRIKKLIEGFGNHGNLNYLADQIQYSISLVAAGSEPTRLRYQDNLLNKITPEEE